MATVKMYQGDSFPVYIALDVGGTTLTPDMLSELEVSVGTDQGGVLRYTLTGGRVGFDNDKQQFWILPSQEETIGLDPDGYTVIARPKFRNSYETVQGVSVGSISILDGHSEEVL